jgi:hypothetical protein
MWDRLANHLALVARAANENGTPAITDPWPVKDVSPRSDIGSRFYD